MRVSPSKSLAIGLTILAGAIGCAVTTEPNASDRASIAHSSAVAVRPVSVVGGPAETAVVAAAPPNPWPKNVEPIERADNVDETGTPDGDEEAPLSDDKRHCSPLPQVGSRCLPTQSYCVVDWGSPGGASTSLECHEDGTWHMIQERNEPF